MIKDIFIPEKIGNTYLFARRILSVHIHKTHINACQIYIKGSQITIEKCFEQAIEPGSANEYPQRVAHALALIMRNARYNHIYTTLNSTQAIFKKMTVPFIDTEKIEMVVPYEVEPLLPFPLQNAVIDFFVIQVNSDQKSSDIFVVAVQTQHISQHIEYFTLAGVAPHLITVDLVSIYGLFKQVSSYHSQYKKIALISINMHDTYILYIYNGLLYAVRTLTKGLFHIAKMASTHNGAEVSTAHIMEQMVRFGVDGERNHDTQSAMESALQNFWQEIQFTLSSFTAQIEAHQSIDMVLLTGMGASLHNHSAFVQKALQINCQTLSLDELVLSKKVLIRDNHTNNLFLTTIAAAYPNEITQNFNLKKGEFSTTHTGLLTRQLSVGLVLFSVLLISFFIHSFWQRRKLTHEYQAAEQEVVTFLRQKFPAAEDETNPEEIRDIVEKEIRDQQRLWFGLANPSRLPLLSYLLELTNLIDKESVGFDPEKITITPELLIIKGSVRDFDALKVLERDLSKSPLFSHIEPQDDPSFTMPIRLSGQGGR